MIVHTERLAKHYGNLQALKGIDMQIAGGGIVGLLGPNGAGKTTLIEIIEGLRQPTAGTVRVLGFDPVREPQNLKQRIGVQLQSTAMPPDLTAAEVLKLFAAFYRNSIPIETILDKVNLREKARQRTSELSGGQRQRLAVGLALVNDPELILLDEPTTGLDPVARRQLHDIVLDFKKQGRTVLLTTHYIEEAEKLCDRIIMIKAGEIVADGTPFELVGRAGGASTLWIAVDGDFDPAPLLRAGATPHGREGEHYRFLTPTPATAITALGEMLRDGRFTLTDLRLKRPTLEDVYIEMVGELEDDMVA